MAPTRITLTLGRCPRSVPLLLGHASGPLGPEWCVYTYTRV